MSKRKNFFNLKLLAIFSVMLFLITSCKTMSAGKRGTVQIKELEILETSGTNPESTKNGSEVTPTEKKVELPPIHIVEPGAIEFPPKEEIDKHYREIQRWMLSFQEIAKEHSDNPEITKLVDFVNNNCLFGVPVGTSDLIVFEVFEKVDTQKRVMPFALIPLLKDKKYPKDSSWDFYNQIDLDVHLNINPHGCQLVFLKEKTEEDVPRPWRGISIFMLTKKLFQLSETVHNPEQASKETDEYAYVIEDLYDSMILQYKILSKTAGSAYVKLVTEIATQAEIMLKKNGFVDFSRLGTAKDGKRLLDILNVNPELEIQELELLQLTSVVIACNNLYGKDNGKKAFLKTIYLDKDRFITPVMPPDTES